MSKSFLGKGLLTSAAALAVLFGFSTQTSAQEPWQNNFPVGKIVESIEGDLDGDDIPETSPTRKVGCWPHLPSCAILRIHALWAISIGDALNWLPPAP